jgi:RNA polymerase sigma factor (sigma-70 family)
MPRKGSKKTADSDAEKLFLQTVIPIIPTVVRKVCAYLGRYTDETEVAGFSQQIKFLLWENNYRVLRSFKQKSSLETWLFSIAKRSIRRWLRERDKMESLEQLPPDALIVQPKLEEWLLSKERQEILQAAVCELTPHDQKLFGLWRNGQSIGEIAIEMKIRNRSVSRELNVVIKKLQEIIKRERAI